MRLRRRFASALRLGLWNGDAEQLAYLGEIGGAIAVGEQAVMADAMQPLGQHMHQELPNKFGQPGSAGFLLAGIGNATECDIRQGDVRAANRGGVAVCLYDRRADMGRDPAVPNTCRTLIIRASSYKTNSSRGCK
jgi:hypothetical protein